MATQSPSDADQTFPRVGMFIYPRTAQPGTRQRHPSCYLFQKKPIDMDKLALGSRLYTPFASTANETKASRICYDHVGLVWHCAYGRVWLSCRVPAAKVVFRGYSFSPYSTGCRANHRVKPCAIEIGAMQKIRGCVGPVACLYL